jgi:hypothetical protein
VQDGLLFITELALGVTYPATLAHIIFGSYGIKPNESNPNFDLQRNFCFPQVFERTINAIAAEVFVHRLHRELPSFGPFPNWFILTIG